MLRAWDISSLPRLARLPGENEAALTYAERSLRIAREMSTCLLQAETLVVIGHANAGLHRLENAADEYQQALEILEALNNTIEATEPRRLACLDLLQNDLAGSLAYVEEILKVLADHPRAGLDEPFNVYLTCYRVLEANHDPRG